MDLIKELSSKIGVNPDQAQALAGAVLGGVKSEVSDKLGPDEGQQFDKAIPELGSWMDKGKSLLASAQGGGGESGGGGLLGAAAGMLGGGGSGGFDLGTIGALLGKLNLDGGKVGGVVEIVAGFLKNRLGGGLFEKIAGLVPMLGSGGGIAGALGGLLDKK